MKSQDREVIVQALVDGQEDGLMLVPTDTDNQNEHIRYGDTGFQHVTNGEITTTTPEHVLEAAEEWTVVQADN